MKILALILVLHTANLDSSNRVVQGVEIIEGSYDTWKSGYKSGWVDGYCFDQESNHCNSPYPPASPAKPPQDNDTYKDGYSRGFVAGRKAYRNR